MIGPYINAAPACTGCDIFGVSSSMASTSTTIFGVTNNTGPTSTTTIFGTSSSSGPALAHSVTNPFGSAASNAAQTFSPAQGFVAVPFHTTSSFSFGQQQHSVQQQPFRPPATALPSTSVSETSPLFEESSPLPAASMPFGKQQQQQQSTTAVHTFAFGGTFCASPALAPFGDHQAGASATTGFGGMIVPAGSHVFGAAAAGNIVAADPGFSLGPAQMSGDQSGRRKVAARRRAAGR
jgi:hypothetical protein